MIKLIIFDLWNTLAYRKSYTESSVGELAEAFKIKKPHKEMVKLFENTVQTRIWETEYDAYHELLEKMNVKPTKSNILKAIAVRGKAETKVVLYNHVVSMLKQLRKQKIKIGLLSNSSVFIIEIVKKETELFKYIDYPVFSFEIEAIKPDPVMYLEMQRISKITNPKEIIMIGDNLFDDIYPAQELGLNAIHYKGDYEELKKELKKFKINIR